MDADVSQAVACKEKSLEKCLQQIITEQELAAQRQLIQRTAAKLNVNLLDCAAALLYLSQPLLATDVKSTESKAEAPQKAHYRSVRYRLDVGSHHHVTKEQIEAVLIEESGVDKKRIGRIDIRQNHTLVELPDGMPADIFQLLSEATIGNRKLAIKRVKPNRRRSREVGERR